MAKTNIQPKWDKYEAVLLLEAVLNVNSGKEERNEAIKRISLTLRKLAVNRGLSIDDTYRNVNGISFQFQSMEFSALGKKNQMNKTGSKLFDEVVALYRDKTAEYNRILATAHANTDGCKGNGTVNGICINDRKDLLKKWLILNGNTENKANWIIDCFDQVSKYSIEKRIFQEELLSISDAKKWNNAINALQANKFFRVLKRDLYKFLQSYSKIYLSFLKKNEATNNLTLSTKYTNCKVTYIRTDVDENLVEKFGEKVEKIYKALSENDRHVYLTIEQICAITSVDTDSATLILQKASWSEKLSDGYILGHNNSSKQSTITLDVSEAFNEPTKVESVLMENFRRGFRPESIMDRNRFIALYEAKYNTAICTNDVIEEVQKNCFRFDDRFFLPKALVNKDTAKEVAVYISRYFSQKEILYYDVLYNIFEDKCESFIYSAEMLVAFLKKILVGTPIFYSDRFCSIKENAMPDLSSEIVDYLIKMDVPCSYEVIYAHFSYLNQKDIYNILHYNNPEILGNSKFEYFHVKTAHLTDNELEKLKNTTETLLSNSVFITCNEVMNSLTQSSPALMERLKSKFSTLGIRRIFTYYLRVDFDVDTGIITRKGMKMTVVDAFADFAKSHKHFTVNDVQGFAEYTGTVPYWDTVHKYAVRINATEFVSDSEVDFDVEAIDAAIDFYCGDYASLSEIPDYSRFPSCGIAWNIYLLQQYVFRFSQQFKLLSLGFAKGNVAGVIVRKQSGFDDFESVVVDALEKTNITSPDDAIQYLCDKGFIAEKRYKKHVDLLKLAMARRNNR